MTKIAAESFTEIYPELLPLFHEHWRELGPYKDRMPLSPNLQIYTFLEATGQLVCLTARKDGRLVGYLIAKVGEGLHYSTTVQAITDIPYIHPDLRGRGILFRLFEAAEAEFKRRGVGPWFASSKILSPLHKSMDRLLVKGFAMQPCDLQYSKWIS